jgi:hypothetical protein
LATKAEARNQALQLLGVLQLGQSAQSQDATELETAYTEVYAGLKEEGLATWAEAGSAIPDKVVPHLVSLMALSRTDTYGVSDSRYQRILNRAGANGRIAKREIRKVTTPDYESLDEPTDY